MHSYQYRPSPTNRLTALALSLAICALIIIALIRMGMLAPGGGEAHEHITAVNFRGQSAEQKQHRAEKRTEHAAARKQLTQTVTPHPVTPQPQVVPQLPFIKLSREEFAASDISKMQRHPSDSSADSAASQSSSAYGPGEGPGGARLYNAEWYREPTHAELVTYMPHRDVSGGWAMIACKTQEHFHVDDCQELGESPPGSGLARALRQAAWQFLVRPPRIEGKPMIGAWVRIRFDFKRAATGDADDAPQG